MDGPYYGDREKYLNVRFGDEINYNTGFAYLVMFGSCFDGYSVGSPRPGSDG